MEKQKLFICIDKDPLARIAIMTSLLRTKVTFYLKALLVTNLTIEDESDVMKLYFANQKHYKLKVIIL